MTQDISGFGLRVTVRASQTFPTGLTITQFADDSDPLDIPSQQIMEVAMGLNGDMIAFSKANPLRAALAVIPDSEDDKNLAALADKNRVGKGKRSARDTITMTVGYPDGSTVLLTQGKILDGAPANGVASAGRFKTKIYMFAFESITRA